MPQPFPVNFYFLKDCSPVLPWATLPLPAHRSGDLEGGEWCHPSDHFPLCTSWSLFCQFWEGPTSALSSDSQSTAITRVLCVLTSIVQVFYFRVRTESTISFGPLSSSLWREMSVRNLFIFVNLSCHFKQVSMDRVGTRGYHLRLQVSNY